MQVEVTAAINLIAASLYNKLPRRRVDAFAEEVEKGIVLKFQGHWYPDNPSKGAAYRCINVSGELVDPLFVYAAVNSGMDLQEVISYLPKDLIIWIDPGEVSFSIGDKSQVRVLYTERRSSAGSIPVVEKDLIAPTNSLPQPPTPFTSCPAAVTPGSSVIPSPLSSPDELTSSLSSSLGSLSLSSGGSGANGATTSWGAAPSPIPWPSATNNGNPWSPVSPQRPTSFSSWNNEPNFNATNVQPTFQMGGPALPRANNSNKTMTAAMFAQTKFGSTKLKNNTKRSSRLSPTESFSRSLQGSHSYANGSIRQNPAMTSAFLDRMHTHMNNNNHCDFPIDHFKMSGNAMRAAAMSSDRLPMSTVNGGHSMGSSNGVMGRYSPCTINSSVGGLLSSDQDWIDLTDIALPCSGSQLLAA